MIRRFGLVLILLTCSSTLLAAPRFLLGVSQRPTRHGSGSEIVVHAERVSLAALLDALEPFAGQKIVAQTNTRKLVDFDGVFDSGSQAVERLARDRHLALSEENGQLLLRDPSEATVTLDVKDADVHEILKSIKKQCGIRNLIVDGNVQGSGTFLFTDLPCETALKTVFSTLGLAAEFEPGSLVHVNARQ